MANPIHRQQSKGIQWNTITSILVFVIQLTVSYFLNKMIAPSEFGKALWAFAIVGFGLFLSHFSWFDILVRKKDVNEDEYSTAFFISIVVNGLLFCFYFFGAGWLNNLSNEFIATQYIQAFSILHIANAIAMVPLAKLTKAIEFKLLSKMSLFAKLIASTCAIVLAITNRPFLSLLCLYMGSDLLLNLFLILTTRWLPNFNLNVEHVKGQIQLASTLTFQKFAGTIGHHLDSILIGNSYADTAVANYTKSYGIRTMPVSHIARSITKVTFPTLSQIQDDEQLFKSTFFDTQHFIAFVLLPLFGVLFVLAEPFSIAYFSEDWDIDTITILLRIFAIAGAFAAFNPHFDSLFTLKASAKTINQLTIIQRLLFLILLIVSLPFGIIAIAAAKLISSILDFLFYALFTKQFLQNYFQQSKLLVAPLINTILSGLLCYVSYIILTTHLQPLILCLISGIIYALSYLFLSTIIDKKGIQLFRQNFLNRHQ